MSGSMPLFPSIYCAVMVLTGTTFLYSTSHDAQTELYKLKMDEVNIKKSNPYVIENTLLIHYTE